MRIVKLSKEVYGFEKIEGCLAYFKHVLPWQKYEFNIMGEGHHIGMNTTNKGDIILFSYMGEIVCMARVIETDELNNKVNKIKINKDSVRFFKNRLKLEALEAELKKFGYVKNIVKTQGWNLIEDKYEKYAIEKLIKNDYEEYL